MQEPEDELDDDETSKSAAETPADASSGNQQKDNKQKDNNSKKAIWLEHKPYVEGLMHKSYIDLLVKKMVEDTDDGQGSKYLLFKCGTKSVNLYGHFEGIPAGQLPEDTDYCLCRAKPSKDAEDDLYSTVATIPFTRNHYGKIEPLLNMSKSQLRRDLQKHYVWVMIMSQSYGEGTIIEDLVQAFDPTPNVSAAAPSQ
jgi:hypothetical protein